MQCAPRGIGDRAFSVAEPRPWHSLSTDLKLLRDRQTLKAYLDNLSFCTDTRKQILLLWSSCRGRNTKFALIVVTFGLNISSAWFSNEAIYQRQRRTLLLSPVSV